MPSQPARRNPATPAAKKRSTKSPAVKKKAAPISSPAVTSGTTTAPSADAAFSAVPGARMLVPQGATFRVRMYRQGLGDCFLLAFPTADPHEPFYMLIDCGVILGTADASAKMLAVVKDIRAATNDRLDILVATHEHWDHLSGFIQAQGEFRQIRVKTLWLAWTEDPGDTLANQLRGQRARVRAGLRASLTRFETIASGPNKSAAADHLKDRVAGLLEFFGASGAGAPATGGNTASALDWVKQQASAKRYCRPGEDPIALENTKGVRAFVLGPPHDEKAITHSDASSKEKSDNIVYHLTQQPAADAAFFAAALGNGASADPDLADMPAGQTFFPFDPNYSLSPDDLGRKRKDRPDHISHISHLGAMFFKPTPTPQAKKLFKRYFKENDWQRIDADWLEVGAELALKLDSDTNNTSLALAIELSNGEVLLFPADAQVGNWTSWQTLTWKLADPSRQRDVTAADLLNRTVLYKVGHHSSHNATLRVGGLEAMGSDLIALIPVNHEMAVKKKWNMPFPPLLDALQTRTRGRTIRVDEGIPASPPTGENAPSAKEWAEFKDATRASTALYIDYVRAG